MFSKLIKLRENNTARLRFFSSFHAKNIIKTLEFYSTDIIIFKTIIGRMHANVVKQNQAKEFVCLNFNTCIS